MRFSIRIPCLAALLLFSPYAACAQEPAIPPRLFPLDKLRYDPAERGPLLIVAGPDMRLSPALLDLSRDTVASLADRLNRRVVQLGTQSVIVPKTMRIIEEHPGKPDPFAGLRAEERLRLLLSLFTEGDWSKAGGARGIGLSDMNDRQRSLFAGLLPEKMVVQRIKMTPGAQLGSRLLVPQGDPHEYDPLTARLRLVRKVQFSFSKEGSSDYSYSGGTEAELGDEVDILQSGGQARGDASPDSDAVIAFGVPIIKTVVNRLKESQMDFASPSLNGAVALDGDIKTVRDLVARIARATRRELIADRRVAGLMEWGSAAMDVRRKTMDGLNDATAKNDPLSHVGFAPGDPRALPNDILQTIDTNYRKERYGAGPDVDPAALGGPLQRAFESQVQFWASTGVSLRRDRTRVNTELAAQFVLPGGEAVEAPFSTNIGSQFLQQIATIDRKAAGGGAEAVQPSPKPMPESLKQRVLIAQLPPAATDAKQLISTARVKGFTEVWLRVMLDDPQAPARLKAAAEAGMKDEIGVGAAVSLLRNGGLAGTEDINVFGETGAEYVKRRDTLQPDLRDFRAPLAGWMLLDADKAAARLLPIARVSGLCALAIKATAAPGWSGEAPGGDGIESTAYLGYDLDTRLACVRSEELDPLDAATHSYELGAGPGLPFFPAPQREGAWSVVMTWRLNRNKASLAKIHASIHAAMPDLPLYLDDRASPYTSPNTRWFARWDSADRIPYNPVYAVESEAREAAFGVTKTPLLARYGWNGNPADLARAVGNSAEQAAKSWRGFVLDLSKLSPSDALKMLGGLP